jgi:hypothetical protein
MMRGDDAGCGVRRKNLGASLLLDGEAPAK